MKELELYEPIKTYFTSLGYKVNAEVKNCDIVCSLNEEIIIIELKKTFSLKLVYQAIDRQTISKNVFIAIPRPKNLRAKSVKDMIKLLKALGLGLITVGLDSPLAPVCIILEPKKQNNKINQKKKSALCKELKNRSLSINKGGSSKKDMVLTAYKETSIFIACILEKVEKTSPKYLKYNYNIENSGNILRDNYQGYFKKISRGVYTLSDKGKAILKDDKYKEVVAYYKNEVKENV